MALTHTLVVNDIERSRRFYIDVFGAEFLTTPVASAWEIRAFFHDSDGHPLEISETRH